MTTEGKAIKEAYAWEAKSQWHDKPLTDDIHVHVTFFFRSHRKRDLDNQNKIISMHFPVSFTRTIPR